MPYELSRDFAHPVSFRVMLSVSVAACTYRPRLVKIDARSFEISW